MKIAVVGAGIAGICTAYELGMQGHQVSVFERHGLAAEVGSFANGGLLSATAGTALFRTGGVGKQLGAWRQRHPAVQWHGLNTSLRWLRRVDKAHKSAQAADHLRLLHALARHSQQHFEHLLHSLSLDAVDRSAGLLILQRTAQDCEVLAPVLALLHELDIAHTVLSPDQAREREPALRADTALLQAIHLPQDGSANCRQFALLLKAQAEELGVQFLFHTEVAPLTHPQTLHWDQGRQSQRFDAVVLCGGTSSLGLLAPLGLQLPLQTVHGYSISAAVREPIDAPHSAVFDERHQVSIARLGQRVRVSGGLELGGDDSLDAARLGMLYQVLDDWFPGAARTHEHPQVWKSSVTCTHDALPVIGPSGLPGLWLNLAHGHCGWTLACGGAQVLADQIGGRTPALDLSGFGPDRLQA